MPFYGLPSKLLHKLHLVQNSAAQIICRTPITEHITPMLQHMHWFMVKYRFEFKILLLTYKARNNPITPSYISDLLHIYSYSHKINFCTHSCSPSNLYNLYVSSLKSWNSLLQYLWNSETLIVFKSCLKTHLFRQTFMWLLVCLF